MQAGYSGETHFRIEVVSPAFEGLKTLKQHRLVYDVRSPPLAVPRFWLATTGEAPAQLLVSLTA